MGESEKAMCDICKKIKVLGRKYYYYDIKCDCCNGVNDNHFEFVRHCNSCIPIPPDKITLYIKPVNIYV